MEDVIVMSKVIGIIRLRGRAGTNYNVEHTLKLMRLHKPNHAAIFQSNEALDGMLFKIKDWATFGEISADTIEHLLVKRGELTGRKPITNKFVKENTKYATIKQLAKAIAKGEIVLSDIPEFRPVFRLNPPRKGFKSLKYPITKKGDLGYRGETINDLFARMT